MKRLTCELCGGINLIKENGLFVCQNCGCKYSIEEAKKLIVEGNITLKIDNSDNLEKYKVIANNAYKNRSFGEAYTYYLKALEIEPSDYESIFFRGLSKAYMGISINEQTADDAVKSYFRAIEIAKSVLKDDEELFDIQDDYLHELFTLLEEWLDETKETIFCKDWTWDNIIEFSKARNVARKIIDYFEKLKGDILPITGICRWSHGDGWALCCDACEVLIDYVFFEDSREIYAFDLKSRQPYINKRDEAMFEMRKECENYKKLERNKYGQFTYAIYRLEYPKYAYELKKYYQKNDQANIDADKRIMERLKRWKSEEENRKNNSTTNNIKDDREVLDLEGLMNKLNRGEVIDFSKVILPPSDTSNMPF